MHENNLKKNVNYLGHRINLDILLFHRSTRCIISAVARRVSVSDKLRFIFITMAMDL